MVTGRTALGTELLALPDRIRAGCAREHAALETALGADSLTQDRLARLLARFHGFHSVWEPALAHALAPDVEPSKRRRLALLEADLSRLGVAPPYPPCEPAQTLTRTAAHALGSFYVLEGSTLGGAHIARSLSNAAWPFASAPAYFTPYGRETAEHWRAFKSYLMARAACGDPGEIVDGARAAFKLLYEWLSPCFVEDRAP